MTPTRTPPVLAIVALAAVLSACTHTQAWVASGESIDALGKTFLATAKQVDAAYEAKRMPPERYAKWRAFVAYFKPTYDMACDRWLHADDSAAQHAATVLAALSAELGEWATAAGGTP